MTAAFLFVVLQRREHDAPVALEIHRLADHIRSRKDLVDVCLIDSGSDAARVIGDRHGDLVHPELGESVVYDLEPAEDKEEQYGRNHGELDKGHAGLVVPQIQPIASGCRLHAPHTTGGVFWVP